MTQLRRRFVDLPWGQMHVREAGAGRTIYLCHGSPGSAKALEPMISRLAPHAHVLAPDTPGNGDSDPLPDAAPDIAALAAAHAACIAAMGIVPDLIFGTHTGAAIVLELALGFAPDRRCAVVLDGLGVFDDAMREQLLARYAFPFAADLDGAWLARLFQFCRDQYIFFPWYARDDAHLLGWSLPGGETLADTLVDVAKARNSYHLSYRAAFAYPALDRVSQCAHPLLLTAAEDDPLRDGTITAARHAPAGRFAGLPPLADPGFADAQAALILRESAG